MRCYRCGEINRKGLENIYIYMNFMNFIDFYFSLYDLFLILLLFNKRNTIMDV